MMLMAETFEIQRRGVKVSLIIRCDDAYESMQLYDKLIEAMEAGSLRLTADGEKLSVEAKVVAKREPG